VHYILLFLKISAPMLVYNCCLEFPVQDKVFLVFVEFYFHLG
jgi:hypothetical protein